MSMNLACSVVSLPQISTWESRLIFSSKSIWRPRWRWGRGRASLRLLV